MAGRDGKQPKEGVDFEWVDSKTSNAKVRRFFTAAEKKAMKDKKAPEAKKAAPKRASTPSKSPRPKSRPAQGGRGDGAAEVKRRKKDNYVSSGRGDGDTETFRRNFDRRMKETYGDKPTPKAKKAGGVTYSDWKKMTRSERKSAGLPTSEIGAQMYFKRFKTGITGKEYTSADRKSTSRGSRGRNRARTRSGMAKGGMVKANCGASMKPTQRRGK